MIRFLKVLSIIAIIVGIIAGIVLMANDMIAIGIGSAIGSAVAGLINYYFYKELVDMQEDVNALWQKTNEAFKERDQISRDMKKKLIETEEKIKELEKDIESLTCKELERQG